MGAHRFAYLWMVGSIEDGMVLDHLCRYVGCANPSHVEPVTPGENVRRGLRGRLVTHCPKDHEYTEANTFINKAGQRSCRACKSLRDKIRYPLRKQRRAEARAKGV